MRVDTAVVPVGSALPRYGFLCWGGFRATTPGCTPATATPLAKILSILQRELTQPCNTIADSATRRLPYAERMVATGS
jgi:hypothetical protein